MYDFLILWDWISFSVRWLHVITAMAWIGASFYFIALDLMLRPSPDLPAGAYGEEWEVHGGGFYHTIKYSVAPSQLPAHLTWHKWQSYTTWLSGAGLLMIVYWVGGELYLLDPSKANLLLWQGILISGGSLAIGWIAYDQMCKSKLGDRPTALMLLLFALLVLMSWGYNQLFTGACSTVTSWRFYRDDHDRQCVFPDHAKPADRGCRPQSGPRAGCEVWKDRETPIDPQQLPDPPGRVLDVVKPLPACVWDALCLDHRQPHFFDWCHNPALFQHNAQNRQRAALDMGDNDHPDGSHCVAVDLQN